MQNQGMNELVKDSFQVSSWIAGILGGLIASFLAIRQFGLNTKQRKKELRWKKANAANEIINKIHSHDWAKNAVLMLDWNNTRYSVKIKDSEILISSYKSFILPILDKPLALCTDPEKDIAYCFDWFFYYVDRLEHNIRIKVIKFKDVKDVFIPYYKKINENDDSWRIYKKFMTDHSYELAIEFWKRYDVKDTDS